MKNVAVFGAGGFLGKSTVHHLQERKGYNIIPITRKNFNLLNCESVKCFFVKEKIDIIIHCANQGGTRNKIREEIDVLGNNLKMFFNIERNLTSGMKFINFGSGAQYNKMRNLIKVSEDEFEKSIPEDAYGYSKYMMSKYIKMRSCTNAPGKIYNLVLFGVFGIGEDYTYRFISNAILKNILKLPITINQNVIFDYLYIEDYFKVLDRLLDDEWKVSEFNVTPSESISLIEIANYINELSKFKSDIVLVNKGTNYQYTGSNHRLLKYMGDEFQFTPYIQAIEKMYHYYTQNLASLDLSAIAEDNLLKYCTTKKYGG